jgi:hypothetical protein
MPVSWLSRGFAVTAGNAEVIGDEPDDNDYGRGLLLPGFLLRTVRTFDT